MLLKSEYLIIEILLMIINFKCCKINCIVVSLFVERGNRIDVFLLLIGMFRVL